MLTVNQEYTQVGVSKIDNISNWGRDCIHILLKLHIFCIHIYT